MKKHYFSCFLLFLFGIQATTTKLYAVDYYVNSTSGNNANAGTSPATAWQNTARVNSTSFAAGDRILFFAAGPQHNGSIFFNTSDIGTPANPITVGSYGTTVSNPRAIIYSDGTFGLYSEVAGIRISGINFYGNRMFPGGTNNNSAIHFYTNGDLNPRPYIFITNCSLEGYGENGVFIQSWNPDASRPKGFSNITIKKTTINNCRRAGININAFGDLSHTYVHSNVLIDSVRAFNNAGILTETLSNTGNGIIVSSVYLANIQNSIVHNNGANNRFAGGGPVGIGFFDVLEGIIQNCESYNNKAGTDVDGGGGFKIDGGSQSSIIQYCYSHDNEGAGYSMNEFGSQNNYQNNTIRYNISQNDGRKNTRGGGIAVSAISAAKKLTNCNIYNNTIYLDVNNLVEPLVPAEPSGFTVYTDNMDGVRVYNNIFYLDDDNADEMAFIKAIDNTNAPLAIAPSKVWFLNNLYYKASNPVFKFNVNYLSLASWRTAAFQENYLGIDYGHTANPGLVSAGAGGTIAANVIGANPATTIPLTLDLTTLNQYRLTAGAYSLKKAINLPKTFDTNIGLKDFYGNAVNGLNSYDLGSHQRGPASRTYYINREAGNNTNDGTSPRTGVQSGAWQSIVQVNNINFAAGDSILFNSQGGWHDGNIYFNTLDIGTPANPITVGSYGGTSSARASIYADGDFGLFSEVSGIKIEGINFYGNRMFGGGLNDKNGIQFFTLGGAIHKPYIFIRNSSVEGFGENGILIQSQNDAVASSKGFSDITIKNTTLNNCGKAGINVNAFGNLGHTYLHSNVLIDSVRAFNNAGVLGFTTHNTGNGILVSATDGAIIQNSVAHDNGANNSHVGGGPVGIWFYNVRGGIIQNCESYNNKAGNDADGGGFDIDGGCQNCVIQYCYSHGNEGAGYGMLEYGSPNNFLNNTIRYNISQNDGRKNIHYGGITLWARNFDRRLRNCNIYNNTIYLNANNLVNPAILPAGFTVYTDNMEGVNVYNNIFYLDNANPNLPFINSVTYGNGQIAIAPDRVRFLNNLYYKASNPVFKFNVNYASLAAWRTATSQETLSGTNYGHTADPNVTTPGGGGIIAAPVVGTNPATNIPLGVDLNTLSAYRLSNVGNYAINRGLDLTVPPFSINMGGRSFFNNSGPVGQPDLGAFEFGSIPLPLLWLSFSGQAQVGQNLLFWRTAQEVNNDYFEIQKSEDNRIFVTIGTTPARADGRYSFIDKSVGSGQTMYYRLKQIDKNLSNSFSRVIVIKSEKNSQNQLSIFPNPISDSQNLNVYLQTMEPIVTVLRIFDMMGKQVFEHQIIQPKESINQPIEISGLHLPVGIYTVVADGIDMKAKKLVVLK